ncbi:MAG: MSMEG_0569 family flavin-dependent oxidoreductase [Pseudonocardiales bacterium]|nr:MSMEG_0569 family flavin-dependent oxidoreductase [Pseudonocardiales bacterium]
MALDGTHREVVVVGGGQAGLAMSWCLGARGIEHLVLEKEGIGHAWRAQRWDSFCLVTPNWQCRLPGFPYAGDDPDGFMLRDQIVGYLRAYADSFQPPIEERTAATRLRQLPAGGFELVTDRGTLTADQVVLATGPYQVPMIPRGAEWLPPDILQIHSADYRSPDQLPEGAVLVVGTGQSGCQIAEDLHLAGRQVHLAVGGAPRVARRYRGRDVVDWLDEMGYYAKPIDSFADVDAVRFRANHYVTGRDGGRDIDLRAFARDGMRLYGRLTEITGPRLTFADDLAGNLDAADAVSEGIKDSIDAHVFATAQPVPGEPRYVPVWTPGESVRELDPRAEGISAVVWCTGFGRDHRWIELPMFDGRGYPTHRRGVSTAPGVYLLGLPWQHTWGSGRFCGVGEDAEHLAEQIVRHRVDGGAGSNGRGGLDVRWLAATTTSTYPVDDWAPTRTVA